MSRRRTPRQPRSSGNRSRATAMISSSVNPGRLRRVIAATRSSSARSASTSADSAAPGSRQRIEPGLPGVEHRRDVAAARPATWAALRASMPAPSAGSPPARRVVSRQPWAARVRARGQSGAPAAASTRAQATTSGSWLMSATAASWASGSSVKRPRAAVRSQALDERDVSPAWRSARAARPRDGRRRGPRSAAA